MTPRRLCLVGIAAVALVAVGSLSLTGLIVQRAWASGNEPGRVIGFAHEGPDPRSEASREAGRRPYMGFHDISDIVPTDDVGVIGLFVDVDCWHGADTLPNLPPARRTVRLRVTVYSPDDPKCELPPVTVWESPAVEIVEGRYQERIPVAIPVPPHAIPYQIMVELVTGEAIRIIRDGEVVSEAPLGLRGERIAFRVR